MGKRYDKCIKEWNNIFSNETASVPTKSTCGNREIDTGFKWVCDGTTSIVDFGCGNGMALFLCALNGTRHNVGIDLSEKAIENAKLSASKMISGEYLFINGGIEALKDINDNSIDAVILFNIIDNLYPDDAEVLINEVFRILKKNGKALVKVNDYLSDDDIKKRGIKRVKEDLLDDGLFLLNKSTKEWTSFFEDKFKVSHYRRVYYEKFEQYNRMFYLIKE